MTKKRIGIYLFFSFVGVWGMTIAYIAKGGKYEDSAMQFILTFSMLAPAMAVLLTRIITKEGLKPMGEDSMMVGINLSNRKWIWYVVALILPVIYSDLGNILLYAIIPDACNKELLNELGISKSLYVLMPFFIIIQSVIASIGGLGEEIGWRGYLYPKMEKLFGTTKTIIFGGIIWGVWHYPAIYLGHNFGQDYRGEPWSGFLVFTVFTIFIGAILWLLTKKTGSVWPAAFMHAVNNSAASVSILRLMFSDEKLTGLAKEPTVHMILGSIPMMVLGIVAWCYLVKNKKDVV